MAQPTKVKGCNKIGFSGQFIFFIIIFFMKFNLLALTSYTWVDQKVLRLSS